MFSYNKIASVNMSFYQFWRTCASKPVLKTYGQKKAYYGDLFPDKLLSKKRKIPDSMYLANAEVANLIDQYLEPHFKQSPCDCIVECNPGIGLFTRKLLDREEKFKKIILMESMPYFINNLQELHYLYPERVQVRQGDIANLWKMVYQDKIDNGSRVTELLRDIPSRPYNKEPSMILFGVVGSYAFYKNLIHALIFETGFLGLGRTEMFLIMPPPIYLHLTCNKECGYILYRSTSILFQIMFEYRFIARLPREHFLPPQMESNLKKSSKMKKVNSINPEHLYLARIIPRQNLYDLCPAEDLSALWYFIKQNCVSRCNRIIPTLEKYVPGCGPRLILNTKPAKSVQPLYPDEDLSKLPVFSIPCTTMTNRDYFPNINIYTQFGDLTPSQMLTLYRQFREWPEYNDCTFLASFENSMLKIETSPEDSIESMVKQVDIDSNAEVFEEGLKKNSSKKRKT